MVRALFVFLLALTLSLTAEADWGYNAPGCSSGSNVGHGKTICYEFDENVTGADLLAFFTVNSSAALACLKPDVTAAGAATAQGVVWYCPTGGNTTATCGIQASAPVSTTLTGLNGIPSVQQACMTLGVGTYMFQITTPPGAGEVGVFTVQGGE